MKIRKSVVSGRKHPTVYVEPTRSIACPRNVAKRILRNLRRVAHSRVDPKRAWRSKQLLEQVEAEQAAAGRRKHGERVAAGARS